MGVGRCGDDKHPKGLPRTQNMYSVSLFAYLLHIVGSTLEMATIFFALYVGSVLSFVRVE